MQPGAENDKLLRTHIHKTNHCPRSQSSNRLRRSSRLRHEEERKNSTTSKKRASRPISRLTPKSSDDDSTRSRTRPNGNDRASSHGIDPAPFLRAISVPARFSFKGSDL